MMQPGMMMGQMALPPSQTWSGGNGAPPPPSMSRSNEHDDRDERDYERRRRRERSRERGRGRSRSRSRSRERSRKRRESLNWRERADEDNRRNRDRSPGRYRDRSPGEEDWRHATPNNTVMIRGLPQNITEQHVQDNITSHGLAARDIRLIRKKDTGASRGFAFVEFGSKEMAEKWMQAQQGWLRFDGQRVSMQYSVPRDQRSGDQPRLMNDWICAKCGVQNFRRRDACFKCSGPRTEYDTSNEAEDEVSTHPTNTVLLSGLDALTTEDAVLNTLGPLTKLPLKSVRVARDSLTSMSRGVCYVEMNSVVDAMFLHNQLLADPPAIEGKIVEVGYHKQPGRELDRTATVNNAAANSALAAAQWTNNKSTEAKKAENSESASDRKFTDEELDKMAEYSANLYAKSDEEKKSFVEYYRKYYSDGGDAAPALAALQAKAKSPDLGMVTVNGIEYQKYPPPEVSKYQFDETSGYYYDKISTLYYDATSQYYFNPKNSKFCYWDSEHSTFLPAPETEGGGAPPAKDAGKAIKEVKGKSAKKIQKDMEKWARKQESKKEKEAMRGGGGSASSSSLSSAPSVPLGGPCWASSGDAGLNLQVGGKATEDLAFSILQQKERESREGSAGLPGLIGYGSDEEEEREKKDDSRAGMEVPELQLTDWGSLACLLCARQFQTREKLQKHNTMSDLHTKNLEEWRSRRGKDLGGQSQDQDQQDQTYQYKDRAKERRKKFGKEELPPENKFKDKYMAAMADVAASGAPTGADAPKLDDSNLGNRMLQKMGWKDGLGLGKKNQGRTEIIQTQSRMAQSGLGTSQPSLGPNDSYKDVARKTLWNRYNDQGD